MVEIGTPVGRAPAAGPWYILFGPGPAHCEVATVETRILTPWAQDLRLSPVWSTLHPRLWGQLVLETNEPII